MCICVLAMSMFNFNFLLQGSRDQYEAEVWNKKK